MRVWLAYLADEPEKAGHDCDVGGDGVPDGVDDGLQADEARGQGAIRQPKDHWPIFNTDWRCDFDYFYFLVGEKKDL